MIRIQKLGKVLALDATVYLFVKSISKITRCRVYIMTAA